MSGPKQLKKSKRHALRHCCNNYTVKYKTAYEQGEARLINISSDGCAFESATVPLSLQEKIFFSFELEEKQNIIEAKAVVVRTDKNIFAVKFILIEPETQNLIRIYFAQKLRDK